MYEITHRDFHDDFICATKHRLISEQLNRTYDMAEQYLFIDKFSTDDQEYSDLKQDLINKDDLFCGNGLP